jgi:hypothetical protein
MGTAIGTGIGVPFGRGSGFPATLTDGTVQMRKVIRDGYLCTDLTIAGRPLGFTGVENTDWENVELVALPYVYDEAYSVIMDESGIPILTE